MLTKKDAKFIRETLLKAENPLFIYDNDPDGLCSYLLLRKFRKVGNGARLIGTKKVDLNFLKKIRAEKFDALFILDIAEVDQELLDKMNCPVIWIDHHELVERKKVHYYNPRIQNPELYVPTSFMAYQVTQEKETQWIAMVGCISDWYLPGFAPKFIKEHPKLLKENSDVIKAFFKDKIGILARALFFLLKGQTQEVSKNIRIISRLESPEEFIFQQTSQAKYLYKHFMKIDKEFQEHIKQARKQATRSKLMVYEYRFNRWSFNTLLANQLSAIYPKKALVIVRREDGLMKMSLRGPNILAPLHRALVGIDGSGGGHIVSCGASVKEDDWQRFIENLKREVQKEKW
jgi:single-stranded DNA-specific DHH superfamily exonuclease